MDYHVVSLLRSIDNKKYVDTFYSTFSDQLYSAHMYTCIEVVKTFAAHQCIATYSV